MAQLLPRREIRFAAAKLVLQLLALRDVPIHHVLGCLATGHDDGRGDQGNVHPLAIAGAPNRLGLDPLAPLGQTAAELSRLLLQFLRHHQRNKRLPDGFGRGVPEQAGELSIHPKHCAPGVEQRNGFGSLVEQLVELRGPLPELGFGARALRDLDLQVLVDPLQLGGPGGHPLLQVAPRLLDQTCVPLARGAEPGGQHREQEEDEEVRTRMRAKVERVERRQEKEIEGEGREHHGQDRRPGAGIPAAEQDGCEERRRGMFQSQQLECPGGHDGAGHRQRGEAVPPGYRARPPHRLSLSATGTHATKLSTSAGAYRSRSDATRPAGTRRSPTHVCAAPAASRSMS
jgi:hypothetical protein